MPTDPKLLALLLLPTILGCGDGRPERVPVSGVILIDGKPLTHGFIQVIPEGQRAAHGDIGEDGKFQLRTFDPNDGCVPGKHKVAIIATESLGPGGQRWHAPKKYMSAETSELEIEVKPDGPNDVKVELTWDGGEPFIEKFSGE